MENVTYIYNIYIIYTYILYIYIYIVYIYIYIHMLIIHIFSHAAAQLLYSVFVFCAQLYNSCFTFSFFSGSFFSYVIENFY